MTLWDSLVKRHNYLFDELAHPLTKGWLLAGSPIPLLTILVIYNVFCTKIGPMLMKNRPPFKLKTTIMLYNIFQVLVSVYLTYEGYVYLFSGNFNFNCQGASEGDVRTARGVQVYLITKLTELLDTIFFVLRKSNRQITFLHLYHHTLMPITSWVGITYFPGGQGALFGVVNSLVHVVMYSYYFLAGLGPQYKKYLWWKKYITVMQIVQFLIVSIHSFNSLFYSCSYLPILKVLILIFSNIFIYMFSKFYYVTYIARSDKNTNVENIKLPTNKSNENNGNHVDDRKTIVTNGNSVNGDYNISSNRNGEVNGKRITNGQSNGSNYNNVEQSARQEKSKDL